jgi:hypothetical protein
MTLARCNVSAELGEGKRDGRLHGFHIYHHKWRPILDFFVKTAALYHSVLLLAGETLIEEIERHVTY